MIVRAENRQSLGAKLAGAPGQRAADTGRQVRGEERLGDGVHLPDRRDHAPNLGVRVGYQGGGVPGEGRIAAGEPREDRRAELGAIRVGVQQ